LCQNWCSVALVNVCAVLPELGLACICFSTACAILLVCRMSNFCIILKLTAIFCRYIAILSIVGIEIICSSVPAENRDLAGRNFCANFAFLCKIAIFHKFCLGAQFLRKFVTLRSVIFRKVCKFCNLRAICTKLFNVFPLKFAFSVLGWRAINFCANWAPYS